MVRVVWRAGQHSAVVAASSGLPLGERQDLPLDVPDEVPRDERRIRREEVLESTDEGLVVPWD